MNIEALQVTLRDFAAARDWQPFHTPKNLTAALMVEAAELMEIFQWMTPEESIAAHTDVETKRRVGEEIADVLLYLVQLADHTKIDISEAVRNKLARNALKYPPSRSASLVQPSSKPEPKTPPVTHVLLDYENVQPTEEELRTLVPAATKVWVFHGPHQKHVESRFASFGPDMTAVPISKTGKNALDFHLSFYMGYIVSRNQQAKIVVVANDKGYGPMLEHATEMGFTVCKVGHGAVGATKVAMPQPKATAAASKPVTRNEPKKSAAKKAVATKTGAMAKRVAAKKVVATGSAVKKVASPPRKNAQKVVSLPTAPVAASAASMSGGAAVSPAVIERIVEGLRKMRDKRPAKMTSLRRALKPLLGTTASEAAINIALCQLIPMGIVGVGSSGEISYPKFA